MAASFDADFEAWLSDRLRSIKHPELRQSTATSADCSRRRTARSRGAMSMHTSNPAGNYYKFVYDEGDDDDYNDNNYLSQISPVDEEPELLPEIETHVESGGRRQRLTRLLGRDAMLALDLADSDPGDLDRLDSVHGPELDENLNRKAGMSRAQDYSTTSLEFSDVDSIVSDRQSDNDGVWGHADQLQLHQEPVGFVEFAPAHETAGDDAVDLSARRRFGRLRQPRYDQLVSVKYHKDDFADVDAINHGDFIDDEALLQRFPSDCDDAITTDSQQLPATSVLPTDVTEMTMDEIQDTVRSRDPIVRVDDPEYRSLRHSKSVVCCCTSPRTTCQRRLFIIAGITALLTATALLVILVYLILTRPVL